MKATKKTPKKPAVKTGAERLAAWRARKAQADFAEVRSIIAHVDDHPEIKQEAAKIVRRRERSAKRGKP